MNWFFGFFFLSGLCSVLYELVWLRLSMAQFGMTTAMVSIVLSIFMAGLGLGSWASGRWLRRVGSSNVSALRVYSLIELLIGVCGILVPYALLLGRHALETSNLTSSFRYYVGAGLWVAAILIPGCALMGATMPIGMLAIAQTTPRESARSFSYLYMANVGGALFGTASALVLIELFGFRGSRNAGVSCNFLIALLAFALSRRLAAKRPAESKSIPKTAASAAVPRGAGILALLFLSGLSCMAMEVVWVRSYTPYLGTVVYAFASILMVYLPATFIGSVLYRRGILKLQEDRPALWASLICFALFPLVAVNPSIDLPALLRLAIGVVPFTGLLGVITPMLVDRYSGGVPERAGAAYAVNVAGCILGPLVAGFGLLPFMGERWVTIVLTLPWLVVALSSLRAVKQSSAKERVLIYASPLLALVLIAASKDYNDQFPERKVLRDSSATVLATGQGMQKQLLVNGYGMTVLTPITKTMAHLPLAFLDHKPQDALAICFGMGTTFRSLRSWGIPVTAVELVPSVPRLFDYYHADAAAVLASPLSHVIIDDGRRYLERTTDQYDLITIDPPPPLEAAGSSLLYSEEFYSVAKRRLRPGGILQQWLPTTGGDAQEIAAMTRSVRDSFPYVRAFADQFGVHFLCSETPLPQRTPDSLLARLPADAVADFVEWAPPGMAMQSAAYAQFNSLLNHELSLDRILAIAPDSPALTDDRPINEYYLLRHWFSTPEPSASAAAR